MIDPAFFEFLLFVTFCLMMYIVYTFKWEYMPVVAIAWAIISMVSYNLILIWYENWYSCISCPWTLMPNYGWFHFLANLNMVASLIAILVSVWVDVKR